MFPVFFRKAGKPQCKAICRKQHGKKPGSADQAPELSIKKSASTTAAINSTREAAASPTDHFPLEASLFFANAYLYLLAINFSPNPVADCINPISKRCAQSIQYHIIHIKAANFVSSWITSIVRLITKPDNMIKKPFRIFPVITGRINPYGTNPSTFPKTFVKSAKCTHYFSISPETPDLHKRNKIVTVFSFCIRHSSVSFGKEQKIHKNKNIQYKKSCPEFFYSAFCPFSNILPCLNSPKSHTEQRAGFSDHIRLISLIFF